jgi:hypothetical protein
MVAEWAHRVEEEAYRSESLEEVSRVLGFVGARELRNVESISISPRRPRFVALQRIRKIRKKQKVQRVSKIVLKFCRIDRLAVFCLGGRLRPLLIQNVLDQCRSVPT